LQQVFAEPWRVRPAYQPVVDLERRIAFGRCFGLARRALDGGEPHARQRAAAEQLSPLLVP
jgi:hypothetical protein